MVLESLHLYRFCFFFSSRRRHTRFDCDWSSDVCSSDLATGAWSNTANLNTGRSWHTATLLPNGKVLLAGGLDGVAGHDNDVNYLNSAELRSEERRVGKECRSRWSPYH